MQLIVTAVDPTSASSSLVNASFCDPAVCTRRFLPCLQVHELLTTDGLSARAASAAPSSHPDAIELQQEALQHSSLRLTSAYPSVNDLCGWNVVGNLSTACFRLMLETVDLQNVAKPSLPH